MKLLKRTVCAVLTLIIMIVPLAGCSSQSSSSQADRTGARAENGNWQNGAQQGDGTQSGSSTLRRTRGGTRSGSTEQNTGSGTAQQNSTSGGASSSQTQILGKVTSIIGNEVELAVGTQSGSQSSSELTLTGETKTLLIPVGLSLSGSGGFGAAGTTGAMRTAAGNAMPSGSTPTGNAANKSAGTTMGASTRTGTTRTGTTGTTRTGTSTTIKTSGTATTNRTSDFSSITKGMVLRITQKTIDDTLTVVKVAIISK